MRTFKYQWSSALGTSLACHVVALGLITGFMLLFPASPVNKGPIEVDLVTMSGGGGGGAIGLGGAALLLAAGLAGRRRRVK